MKKSASKAAFYIMLLSVAALSGCDGKTRGGNEITEDFEPKTYTVASDNDIMPSTGILESEFEDSPLGFGLGKLVDNDADTKFVTSKTNFYILWTGSESVPVNCYSITSAPDTSAKDPKSWTLYGSTNNSEWVEIDKRADQTFPGRKVEKKYEFENTTPYKYFKLTVEANNGGKGTQMAEYSLMEKKMVVIPDIADLMTKVSGRSNSSQTPMGSRFENGIVATQDQLDWLNNPDKNPLLEQTSNGDLTQWKEFPVTLYPYGAPIPADCNQHAVGDCSAVAVLASFAYIYPDFIKDIVKYNGDNSYTVNMFDPKGNPVKVTVNNTFAADNGGTIGQVTGKNNVACWSTIMEKAIMKWQYVYRVNYQIGGIGTEHVAPLFTGNGNSFAFSPGALTNEELTRAVKALLMQGQLVIGGFQSGGTPIEGLGYGGVTTVNGHAYTFMHAANPSALFVMRNPWGGHNGNIPGSADGQINIPDNSVVPPIIDLRVVEPGKAANYGSGIFVPYTPPTFTRVEMIMRVTPEIMNAGR